MQRICVFCGTAAGQDPRYAEAARAFGETLLRRRIGLVYGGSQGGLMQALAETVLAGGGEVIGVVVPKMLASGRVFPGLTEVHKTDGFATRKAMFAKLGDAFIALPGGYGTFDELFEMVAWTQVGDQAKPCGVLNVAGYFDPLIALRDRAITEGFVKERHRDLILVDTDPDGLIEQCLAFRAPEVSAWNRVTDQ
jgi:uncharacterized protein (TIGR00730 family)